MKCSLADFGTELGSLFRALSCKRSVNIRCYHNWPQIYLPVTFRLRGHGEQNIDLDNSTALTIRF